MRLAALTSTPRPPRPVLAASGALLVVFAVLTRLVHARLLVRADLASAGASRPLEGDLLDLLAVLVSVLLSAECSVVFGIVASLVLWHRGLRLWALAPLAFLLLVPVELLLKHWVDQPYSALATFRHPQVPIHGVSLISVRTPGSFPSGHAVRSGFFGGFLASLFWSRGRACGKLGALGVASLFLIFGLLRAYANTHWLSDIVAGLALGASLALVVAARVAEELGSRRASDGSGCSRGRSWRRKSGR
jgi:membrane-associated phospholipid phosphatase